LFATNEPKSNVWAHYNHLLEPCLPWMSPSPTLGSIIKKSKALQVLRVEDHQKTGYKPISFNGTIPQTSKTKDKAHKLQRIKPTSLQASKVHPTNFKGIIPQASKDKAHKLQRTKFKPTKQWLTTTSFKASKLKFKAHQAVAHNTQASRLQSSGSKPTKWWPVTLKFQRSSSKDNHTVDYNNKVQRFENQLQAYSKAPQA
jgi:hypothetical protein